MMTNGQPSEDKAAGLNRFIPRPLRTTAFGVTLIYMLLFVAAVGFLGAFMYRATIIEQRRKVEQELRDEIKLFSSVYETNGLFALGRFMDRRVSASHTVLYYMVVPPYGEKLAGNLTNFPPEALHTDDVFEFTYELLSRDEGDPFSEPTITVRPAMALVARLPARNGQSLGPVILVGRDVADIVGIRTAARAAIIRVAFITLALGLFVGVMSSRAFLQRLDAINRTARAIRQGDLTKRIPRTGADDEFDHLAANLNQMLDQIERLMVGMRQVSDNIAHDLRSPLTRIRNRLDEALQTDPAGSQENVQAAAEDVERLLATFNALLAMTRIEAGERRKGFSNIDLQELVEEIAELYEPAAEEADFTLEVETQPVPPVYASRELISQALSNLLDNAFKYARHDSRKEKDLPQLHPKILIRLAPKVGGGALLEVLDNGPGVPEAERPRILQRFVRLESSRSTQGNGLGLSMVASIASAHQAQLSLTNGLPHDPDAEKGKKDASSYGLGVRLSFPPLERAQLKADSRPLIDEKNKNKA